MNTEESTVGLGIREEEIPMYN